MARVVRMVRWTLTPLAAMAAALAAQFVVFHACDMALDVLSLDGSRALWAMSTWAIKTVTSIFMGAAFVAAAWRVAPQAKRATAATALAVVVFWGSRLMVAAFQNGFFGWLFAMGVAGIAGGALVMWWVRRRGPEACATASASSVASENPARGSGGSSKPSRRASVVACLALRLQPR
jgi:hypothetical protein